MTEEVLITEESTIPQVLKAHIALHPDWEILVEREERLTYREFGERVDRLAAGLHGLGVKPGEKIAMILPSCIKHPVILFAAAQIGAASVGVNPYLRAAEFKHILNNSESVALIVKEGVFGANPLSIIRDIRADLPHLRYLIVDGEAAEGEVEYDVLVQQTGMEGSSYQPVSSDPAALLYTSGTTGLPKGSIYTHRTFLKSPNIVGGHERLPSSSMYSVAPPFTGSGAFFAFLSIFHGVKLAIQERFTPYETIKLIEKEKLNTIFVPPTAATFIVQHPDLSKHNTSSLIYIISGGAPVPQALVQEVREKLDCYTMIIFGGTEAGLATHTDPFNDPDWVLEETVGKPIPGYELKLVDDERKPVPMGEVGEIAFRGASVMVGYYNDEELTRKTIDEEGWCYTGDLGKLDEDGYLRVVGRKKDMIIRGGVNVYPAELEAVMITHPKIKLVAVVGAPDKVGGEKVVAFVIPMEGETLSQLEVLNFCRENMAYYRVPNEVRFVEKFPLTPTGKVQKYVLREQLIAEMQ